MYYKISNDFKEKMFTIEQPFCSLLFNQPKKLLVLFVVVIQGQVPVMNFYHLSQNNLQLAFVLLYFPLRSISHYQRTEITFILKEKTINIAGKLFFDLTITSSFHPKLQNK